MSDSNLHKPIVASLFRNKEIKSGETRITREVNVEIRLNGTPLVILPASPGMWRELAAGFLFSWGLIDRIEDLKDLREKGNRIEAKTGNPPMITPGARQAPNRAIGTGGGGGVVFSGPRNAAPVRKIRDRIKIPAREILRGGKELLSRGRDPADQGRGLHYSFLWGGGVKLAAARDIARHNTMDKVIGDCLLRGVDFPGTILFSSGRISSEMAHKAARAGIPVLVTQHFPTDRALAEAKALGLSVIGYLRKTDFTVFSRPERISRDE
ncbi:MAG: formate dehydrogenase accessory sulfurtransferase FdhD [bacterium]|nr:formate dehydrogenase accessory sulfurtransferase FdhD [bacterium]